MPNVAYNVYVAFDEEANVWYVSESEVPGLVTEAPSFEKIRDKIFDMSPEMFELNGHTFRGDVLVRVHAEESQTVHLAVA